jgi:hypothetical protein
MIQDDWIKMKVVMTYNKNVVDNLVPTKIEETLAKLSKKKSHNLKHIIQYLTLVKKCLRFHDIII